MLGGLNQTLSLLIILTCFGHYSGIVYGYVIRIEAAEWCRVLLNDIENDPQRNPAG